MKKMTFDELRELLLYRKITSWNRNTIVLDNGIEISIEETDQDCCAHASGEFTDVVLDAAITNVSDIKYESWNDDDTYGCSATVTIVHNQNVICRAVGDADAGNGGYYYSVASFVVRIPTMEKHICYFVSEDDSEQEE